jgi:hypothetical protein
MDLKSCTTVLERATRQWDDDSKPLRDRVEDAWFTLFTLRAQDDLLPPEALGRFLELWDRYGGLDPASCTHSRLALALNGMNEKQLEELEMATRALRDEFRMRVELSQGD